MKKKIICAVFVIAAVAGLMAVFSRTDERDRSDTKGKGQKTLCDETEKIAGSYREIYETAQKEGNLNDLKTVQKIVEKLAGDGHTAVDFDGELNM